MPRLPGRRALPWMMVLEGALVAREHWGRLDDRDRSELARIVRKSRLQPRHLTAQDRSELRRIVAKLDLLAAGRRLAPLPWPVRQAARLRRR